MSSDLPYIQRAIELAQQGRGWTSPHPMAGAVVVQGDQIVGEGFHPHADQPAAETYALDAAGEAARGGSLYLTIEPNVGAGRASTVEAIAAAGISRVVIACEDPNLHAFGRGVEALRALGLTVEVGCGRELAVALNEAYFKFITTRRPFVALRTVMSLDGKIATVSGESQYLGGNEAQRHLQQLRASHDAVLIGVTTVIQDNPDIQCLLPRARNPLRIVLDAMARMPLTSKLLAKSGTGLLRPNTVVVVTKHAPEDRIRALQAVGAEILVCQEESDSLESHVDLNKLMQALGRREIVSILFEGGGNLNAAALDAGIVDKIYCTIAPIILGGQSAMTPVEGMGVTLIDEALPLYRVKTSMLGQDLLVETYLRP